MGIIGRVNVGKSLFLNAFMKKERSFVFSVVGMIIDFIDEIIFIGD